MVERVLLFIIFMLVSVYTGYTIHRVKEANDRRILSKERLKYKDDLDLIHDKILLYKAGGLNPFAALRDISNILEGFKGGNI